MTDHIGASDSLTMAQASETRMNTLLDSLRALLSEGAIIIAQELISAGEPGVALEWICDDLFEHEKAVPQQAYVELARLGNAMRLNPARWERLPLLPGGTTIAATLSCDEIEASPRFHFGAEGEQSSDAMQSMGGSNRTMFFQIVFGPLLLAVAGGSFAMSAIFWAMSCCGSTASKPTLSFAIVGTVCLCASRAILLPVRAKR